MLKCSLRDLWVEERLVLDKAVPRYRRPGRPISVLVVPCGPGIDIWQSLDLTAGLSGV